MAVDALGGVAVAPGQSVLGGSAGVMEDQFMKILLTQLRYQDPLEPMKEHEFLAQLAQFQSAIGLENLNNTVGSALTWMVTSRTKESLLGAANLIGATFRATTSEGIYEGVIDSAWLHEGVVYVKSDEMLFPLESLVYVGPKETGSELS